MDKHLLELSQFQFPSISIDELTKEPYLTYLQYYKETYSDFKFYRGFINPNGVVRSKIYRAIHLSCKNGISMKDLIIFNTNDGLIIKIRTDNEKFLCNFDNYMLNGDNYVFIPENCDKLDKYNYSYYRRMMNNFIENEQISGKPFRMNEIDSILLFLSLDECYSVEHGNWGNATLERKWKEYIQGGVIRKYTVPSDKLCVAMKVFSWIYRVSFEILTDDFIEFTVKSPSIKDFESRLDVIEKSEPIGLRYIDFNINDEYEAFGILRILQERMDVNQVIPLMGTSRIYFPHYLNSENILSVLNEYNTMESLPEGNEIFTQDPFSEMSKWRQLSLIKAPSNNLYSFLDLYRNPKKIDPYTREDFPKDFVNQMNKIMSNLDGVFMSGFPPMIFQPELITVASDGFVIRTISFYIKIGERISTFWIIPDLRDTEYSEITLDAIKTLVIKWSNGSLFRGSFPHTNVIPDGDIHLLFSPIALYVFEQTSFDLNIETYPRDIKQQARGLAQKIELLKRCD